MFEASRVLEESKEAGVHQDFSPQDTINIEGNLRLASPFPFVLEKLLFFLLITLNQTTIVLLNPQANLIYLRKYIIQVTRLVIMAE